MFEGKTCPEEMRRSLEHVAAGSGDGTNDAPSLRVHEVVQSGYAKISQSMKRANALLEQKSASTYKAFLFLVVLDTPPEFYGFVLLLCSSFLNYQVKKFAAPFDFKSGKPANTPQSLLLSFDDAFFASFSEIGHMALFILCYDVTCMLDLQL